jgi:hypothetical protein
MKIRAVASARNHRSNLRLFESALQGRSEAETLVLRTVCDADELEGLRSIWQCWPGTLDSNLDFFSSVVRSRPGCQPYVIILFRNARPDAILVGLRERRKLSYKLGWLTISELEINVLEFVSGGLRGCASEENCAAFVRQVMRSLEEGNGDMALWNDLDVQSSLCRYALRWPHFALRDNFPYIDGHWWITNLPDSLNSFFLTRKRSQRSRLRHKHNNVLKHFAGTIRIRCFRSVAELELAIRDIEEIASKSKRRLFGLGFFDTPQSREQMLAMAQKDWLRIYILYLGGKPAAFWKGTLYGGCLQGDHVGYDEAWSKFSPGIFLFLNMIEDLRKEGVNTVDLGFGDTQFKQYLGNLRCLESQVRIYAPTLRGILLNLLNSSCPRINDCARFLLQRTGCLEWARRTRQKRLEPQNGAGIAQASGQPPALEVRSESLDSSKKSVTQCH